MGKRAAFVIEQELRYARKQAEPIGDSSALGQWASTFWADRVAELEYEYREVTRHIFTAKELKGATHVRLKDGWAEVVKINGHTVSVKVGINPQEAIHFKHILEFKAVNS